MTPPVQRAGPLRVFTPAEAVRAFRRETGWRDENGPPPASFPVVWMRLPEIGEPIRAAAQEVGLPVHEAQHFDYVRPLETDASYDLMLELRRESDPMRLIATAEVFDLSGAFVARVISTLRLIDPQSVPPLPPEDAP
ncbi:hypothetical protein K9U39_19155 [Rhodoblastus acidophilus]|uniref:Uncharacterized protein n=1 Tax=Candidatus Rhodoblastus alkanivorans TaxID=2954117 RepID=A0ABS9Z2S6_9HYPH|nr:hypothetical protein [Candidatus Rhodoblastus alkanivorans]MCI4679736.1 hypothetical protein [Candidatus Rhodoblastus alkanivorans]MCI4681974.1 hypothetical protein [Candidatus Rhodoblastus alkanivorans]MDI4643025.1 hypothetical protein [Rhodoblastus acidophilus]